MRYMRLLALVGIVAALGGPAFAGFIDGSFDANFLDPNDYPGPGKGQQGPPPWAGVGRGGKPDWAGPPDWAGTPAWARDPNWQVDLPGDRNHAYLNLDEALDGGGQYPVTISGQTDGDPVIHISKDVENSSGFEWFGYVVLLETSGGASFLQGTADSSHFQIIDDSDTSMLVYGEPDTVPNGETVTLDFDINIPSTGDFNFTLTQIPLYIEPEPATMGLLAVGGGLLFLKRRRR